MAKQGDLTLSNGTLSRTGEVFWVSKTSSKNILTLLPTASLFSQTFVSSFLFVLLILKLSNETINRYWKQPIEEAGKQRKAHGLVAIWTGGPGMDMRS